jgi:hypothetical protein
VRAEPVAALPFIHKEGSRSKMPKYIMCGNLIDATGKEPMKNKILVIEGDRIAALWTTRSPHRATAR